MENRVNNFYSKLLLIVGTILAFYLRYKLFPHISVDMKRHFFNWYDYIKQYGFRAYRYEFSDYTPSYLYLLGIITILPVQKLYAIKGLSVFFDFVAAFFIYKLVKLRYPRGQFVPTLAYLIFLFTPTIVLNSSFWGQNDIIYTTFMLMSLYYMVTAHDYKQNLLGIIFFGIGCSFKGLGFFLLPVYLLICFKRNIPLFNLLLIPLTYIVMVIPALFTGKRFWDLITLIFYQINLYNEELLVKVKASTIYAWLPGWKWVFIPGAISALFIVTFLIILNLTYIKKTSCNGKLIIRLSLLSSLVVPFLLPRMHGRYFFLADVLSILYAFYYPRYFYIPIFITTVSLFNYIPFLFKINLVPLGYLTLVLLVVIVIIFYDFKKL